MDARPQRPLRSMRTFNDENSVPDGYLPKTIHQRNKSSPALSGLANAAGMKAAAKRTVFNDVSNVSQQISRGGKDGTSVAVKVGSTTNIKPTNSIAEKKSAAFLRPAQRPLSVANLRTIFTGTSNLSSISAQEGASLEENAAAAVLAPSNVRKTLTKRATTIFKDNSLDIVPEDVLPEPQKTSQPAQSLPKLAPIRIELASTDSDSRLCLPPPPVSTIIEPVKDNQSAPELLSTSATSEPQVPGTVTSTLAHPENLNISVTGAHLYDESTAVTRHDTGPEVFEPPAPLADVKPIETHPLQHHNQPTSSYGHAEPPMVLPTADYVSQMPRRAEPEEYWEEEDEIGYEEEGYVTARSFRSKGDNTTGGATTVLVPRMNQKARKELEAAAQLVEATRTPEEIEDESYDTSMVAEYGDEIFEYMRQMEVRMSPNPHYMDNQHEIQWSMRSVLMDWLVQVHHRFNLLPETLFLCVNYIDRFLSCKVVSLGKLQLVGATAIFIAAKYEEINCPSVQEIVYMVDGGYTVDEILKAERFMLTMLQFELGWPGPMSFLRRISKADDYDLETRTLAKYFLEVTLMDERFIGSPPSFAAAASHCLARLMLRKGPWSAHHVYYSGYTFAQLRPIVQLLVDCCEDPRKHHSAVYNKYCDKRYKRASAFVETEIQRGFRLHDSPSVKTIFPLSAYTYYAESPFLAT